MLKLYNVPTANGQRASIALEECGLAYDIRNVDLFGGEHRSEDMLAINPIGRMPVLAIGDERSGPDRNIYGSLAIASYASERTGMLQPPDELRPEYHEWTGIVMTDLAPALAGQFYLSELAPEPHKWSVDWYVDIIRRIMTVIDDHLDANEYFLGDDYGLVDVLMYPSATTSMHRIPDGLEPYRNVVRWAERVGLRDAVRRGMRVST